MTETYAITEYSGDRHPDQPVPYQQQSSVPISMQTLALVALVIGCGAEADQISICRRSPTMPYDVVIEFSDPAHVQLMQGMIGGVLRQALAPYDVNALTQPVRVWIDGVHGGVAYRFESSYIVARSQ